MKTLAACLMLLSSAFYAQTAACQMRPNAAAGVGVRDTTTKKPLRGKGGCCFPRSDGSVLLHTQTGKYRLYAVVKDGEIADYSAVNYRGQS